MKKRFMVQKKTIFCGINSVISGTGISRVAQVWISFIATYFDTIFGPELPKFEAGGSKQNYFMFAYVGRKKPRIYSRIWLTYFDTILISKLYKKLVFRP